MTDDFYLIAITMLLPLTALMLVLQVNPYQALVMRGILGATAALVYALFGAADVALTEALVGTMLSITLYAVAVRSSMEMRLGWVQSPARLDSSLSQAESTTASALKPAPLNEAFVMALRQALKPHHLRLEIVAYPSPETLQTALTNQRIHSAVLPRTPAIDADGSQQTDVYRIQTRVQRLQGILENGLPPNLAEIDYTDLVQASSTQSSSPLTHPSRSHSAQEPS